MKKGLLLLVTCFIVCGDAVAGGVSLHLALDTHKTLPSVPVGLTITASNESDAPVTLPRILWMRLDRGDGHPVLLPASNASGPPDGVGVADAAHSIPPHSSRIICSLRPDIYLAGMPWLSHRLVAGVGTFRLTAIANDVTPDISESNLLASNRAELEATPFTDEDRKAWAWLEQRDAAGWTALSWLMKPWADELLATFPRSNYAPYALAFARTVTLHEEDALIRRVLSSFPEFTFADDLKLDVARRYRDEFLRRRVDNVSDAAENAEAARALANEVMAHTKTPELQARAEEILTHTPPRAELMRTPK